MDSFINQSDYNISDLLDIISLEKRQLLFNVKIAINLYCIPILCALGITGNVMSIIVFRRDDATRKTTCFLLQMLAVADIGFLMTCILRQILFAMTFPVTAAYFAAIIHNYDTVAPYVWTMQAILSTAAVYSVVVVVAEWFIAIYHPLQSQKCCRIGNARVIIVVVWVGSVLFNMPRLVERQISTSCANGTDSCSGHHEELHYNSTYKVVYKIVLHFVFRTFIPVILLIIFYVKLIRSMRTNSNESDRHGTSSILVSIVTVFFICNAPGICIRILIAAGVDITYDMTMAIDFSNLLITVSSSIKFLIYLAHGKVFFIIVRVICCCGHGKFRGVPDGHEMSCYQYKDGRVTQLQSDTCP